MADNPYTAGQQPHTPQHITIEDLVGSRIVSADGELVGHVVEIRVSPAPDYRVVELQFGRYGWLDRLNALRLIHGKYRPFAESECIPWEAVAAFERFTVTLKPGFGKKSHSV